MPRSTQVPAPSLSPSNTGLSPSVVELSSSLLLTTHESKTPALQPRLNEFSRFGLIPVRSPLLGESRLISLPAGTEMFHFPALARTDLCIQSGVMEHDFHWVAPFRDPPELKDVLLLPEAYRSIPRLSSPSDAKAST